MDKPLTYIGYCCREWVLAYGTRGRCGICGQIPTYLREDDHDGYIPSTAMSAGDQ